MRCILVLSVLFAAQLCRAAEAQMAIHEWGTFTSFQNELGEAMGGINSDDEPVPGFVHSLGLDDDVKGAARCFADVTMRLETPVLYFHPAVTADGAVSRAETRLDVQVEFRGGWLTEFYPNALFEAPGLRTPAPKTGRHLTSATVGKLAWSGVEVGGDAAGPKTAARVWTAPREVDAANVTFALPGKKAESEKFLFYRGVGHIEAPIRVVRQSNFLEVHSQLSSGILADAPLAIGAAWLAGFKSDGTCAFRKQEKMELTNDTKQIIATIPSEFSNSAYAAGNLESLRKELLAGLIQDGLFADEATALLNTWEVSYFKSSGMRLFFLVPRTWTEHYLPLKISVPSSSVRTMVGRIELVTPEHRALLRKLSEIPDVKSYFGNNPLKPGPYKDLGRFRNSLLLDEQKRHPAGSLAAFIKLYGLEGMNP